MTSPHLPVPVASGAWPVAPVVAPVPGLPDVDVLAALVLTCPAVVGLSGGPRGSAATYLPGRTVPGIRIGDDSVEVHPVLAYGETVGELVRQVRRALVGHVGPRSVDIVVEDVYLPGEEPVSTASSGLLSPAGRTSPAAG